MTTALVRTGVVTVCCGDHRLAAGCSCCMECPVSFNDDPVLLALLASGIRAHRASVRMAVRRAAYTVGLADYWDLYRATARAARPLCELPERMHFEGSLT